MKKIKEILKNNSVQTKIFLVVIIFILSFTFYEIWTRYNSGEITILVPYQKSAIFLDGKKIDTTTKDKQSIMLQEISIGKHSILIYTKGRYPWKKIIYIHRGAMIKIHPFLMIDKLTKKTSGIITKFTKKKLAETKLLFKKQKKEVVISDSGNGDTEIKREGNDILATWIGDEALTPKLFCKNNKCKKIIDIFDSNTKPIKNIGFYPKREDVVIFSLGNSIYAIDIDKKGTQNFQPIYTGDNPDFIINDKNGILYIKDEELIFGVNL